ncbi:MAG: ATP-binding protein [Burkholderiales bacterium]
MPRPAPTPADALGRTLVHRAAWFVALLNTGLALALAAVGLLALGAAEPLPALPWVLAVGLACAAAAVGWTLWRQRALETALHDARVDAAGLAEMVDAWLWRTDAAHCLTLLRPATADADSAPVNAIGRPPWALFGADDEAAATLRRRLESGLPVDGLVVWRELAPGERQCFELHGHAVLDSTGRGAGYLGSARRRNDDFATHLDRPADPDHDQRLLMALLASLPLPVFALDASSGSVGRVVLANVAAARLLGVEPAQLAGLGWSELRARLPEGVGSRAAQAFGEPAAAANVANAAWGVHAQRVELDGAAQPLWVLSLTQARAAEPVPTDHESFGYTVSHDLRAPIRVVEGFTKILKEDYGHHLDRIGNDHLDRVLGAAARMNSMIDALLTLSQLSSRPLARQPVNLSQLASYVADDLRRQSPERQVGVHIEDGLLTQGDPTLLRVVLENLLGNAWKYTAKKPDAQIWFEREVNDGQTAFCVRDNGAGFDMRFADRLFGVFQRLHSANDFQGTGVGLASVQRIVRRHGGEIWAESEVQRGSSFHFTLSSGHPAP